jgi:hypothetical protein
MPRFMIERSIQGAGDLSRAELTAISLSSCTATVKPDSPVEWVESFVTSTKLYCIYNAPDAETIRQQAEQGGYPADSIAAIKRMLDPTGAELD